MILIKRHDEYYTEGIDAVLMEMCNKSVITHKWFRRCCRRHGIGSIDSRESLLLVGIISGREYPLVLTRKVKFMTYEEWRDAGYQVMRGQNAEYNNVKGQAVFHSFQVKDMQHWRFVK